MTPEQAFEELCAAYGNSVCFNTALWRGGSRIYSKYTATVFLPNSEECVTSGSCETPEDALRIVAAKVTLELALAAA